jgi:hypothetical protein
MEGGNGVDTLLDGHGSDELSWHGSPSALRITTIPSMLADGLDSVIAQPLSRSLHLLN